ncbi:MAG TPA: SURF1 family protein [Gammaproteobacteria bacterium]
MRGRAAGRWLALAAAAVSLAALFARLGSWQLDRAAENRAVRDRFVAAAQEPPLHTVPDAADAALRYRRIEVRGRYVPDRQFLLDNRLHEGRVGYEVLTPFRPNRGGPWLLVNRGWVAAGPDRRVLPHVAVDGRERSVPGRLDDYPSIGLRLGDEDEERPNEAAVQVVVFPTRESLEARLERPLAPFQLLLDPAEPDGFARDWQPGGVSPERNLTYAAQWFLFAAAAGVGAAAAVYRAVRIVRA